MVSKWIEFNTSGKSVSDIKHWGPGAVLALGLFLFPGVGWGQSPLVVSPSSSPEPASSAVGEVSAPVLASSPSPSPTPTSLSDVEAKQLLKEFNKAQSNELKALKHRQRAEMDELRASHRAREKEWERRERDARHQFFASHKKGPDRREYIKEFIARREAFHRLLEDEKVQRKAAQQARLKSVQQDQRVRKGEFLEFLSRKERPPSRLWPENVSY